MDNKNLELLKVQNENIELKSRVDEMSKAILLLNNTIVKQRENHMNFQQIADTIEQVFWMTDPVKSSMIFISSAYETIWGNSCEELLENPMLFIESIHPDDRDFVISEFPKQVIGKYDVEYRIIQPSGDIRWIRDKAFPVRNEAGEVYRVTGIASDITEVKAAQEKMMALEKLASLGSVSAGIAHEIKNPLNLIINSAKVIDDEISDELPQFIETIKGLVSDKEAEEISDFFKTIQTMSKVITGSGDRADRIVKAMLMQSRADKSMLVLSDVKSCIEDCLNLSYHSMRANYPFDIQIEKDFDDIGNSNLYIQDLSRAIQNLINNSLYSMNLKVIEHKDVNYKANLKIKLKKTNDSLKLVIWDNGEGIPDEIMSKIFEPFFTTKPPGDGTGLGLSIVNEIISKQHCGTIEIKSEKGEYTEITIEVPNNLTEV
jgi:PAS domain S-box-containing protein